MSSRVFKFSQIVLCRGNSIVPDRGRCGIDKEHYAWYRDPVPLMHGAARRLRPRFRAQPAASGLGFKAAGRPVRLLIDPGQPILCFEVENVGFGRDHQGEAASQRGDRDYQLADSQPARIAEPRESRCLAFEPQYGEVGIGVVADEVRREAAPVGKGRLDLVGAAYNMAVGQDIGVRGEHDTGAGAVDAFIRSGDLQVKDRGADPVGARRSRPANRRRGGRCPQPPQNSVMRQAR
jgi:hypothetical protein